MPKKGVCRSILSRINSKIARGFQPFNITGCILWTGGTSSNGKYPTIGTSRGNPPVYVHRYLDWLVNGEMPVTLQIHHACFNKRCLNTDHYQRVTYQEHAEIHKLYDKFQRMPGFMPHFVDGQFVGVGVEL